MAYEDRAVFHSPDVFGSHKQGRYVVDTSGFLRGKHGDRIDLHAFLTNHRSSVEVFPVNNSAMMASGLTNGGWVLIDKAMTVRPDAIVAVRYNNRFVIRRLVKREGFWCLIADDPLFKDLYIMKETVVEKIGVVIASVVQFN